MWQPNDRNSFSTREKVQYYRAQRIELNENIKHAVKRIYKQNPLINTYASLESNMNHMNELMKLLSQYITPIPHMDDFITN